MSLIAISRRLTVLGGGSPWTTLAGIAIGPTGTLYVANQGPIGPNPVGAGIYALAAPAFAATPIATTAPTAIPSGSAIYVSEAGVPPTLKASAASRQRFSSAGITLAAGCNRTCNVAYQASIAIKGGLGFAQDAAFPSVNGRRSLRIKLPQQVNTRIASALRRKRAVTATLTATPQDPQTGAPGANTKLVVHLTK